MIRKVCAQLIRQMGEIRRFDAIVSVDTAKRICRQHSGYTYQEVEYYVLGHDDDDDE